MLRSLSVLGLLLGTLSLAGPVHAAPPEEGGDDEPEAPAQPEANEPDEPAKGDAPEEPGDAKPDDDAKGDESKGDESKGDESKGDESKGDESKGDESKGDESKGDESQGDESKGDDTKGDDAGEAKPDGADADGPDAAPGGDADGPDGDAEAPAAVGDFDAEPVDPEDLVPVEDLGEGIALNADGDVILTCAKADHDCDGNVEPDELAQEKEFTEAFADIPDTVTDDALDKRSEDAELVPSLTVEDFRKLVRIAKAKVLTQMSRKLIAKSDQRMAKIGWLIFWFSLAGVLLLATPLVLARKYPGKGGLLAKYSALAAVTFTISVNLFGAALLLMRGTQAQLAEFTNPQIAVAAGFFDTLDEHAEDFIVTGKELFAPTLEQLARGDIEQPTALLIANGRKIVEDASVFTDIASMFKKVDWLFGVIPIVLLGVTMLLFVRSVLPTLIAIVKLPAQAAAGAQNAGQAVVQGSMRRIRGEFLATICTVGLLFLLTVISASILGAVVKPALQSLLSYFSLSLSYLQFVANASSGLVYSTLISVILFLVLNLGAFIVSMALFLGKAQKVFQSRFNDGVPLSTHGRFWKWGLLAAIVIQLIPLLYVYVSAAGLNAINDAITGGITDAELVSWGKLLLAGPMFLLVGFLLLFWIARGVKALKFLGTYKVPPPAA
jgi:hypothetical protein